MTRKKRSANGLLRRLRWMKLSLVVLVGFVSGGCYVPLRSPALPATALPDEFRTPVRSLSPHLNYANVALIQPQDYLLGPGDRLEITIPNLYDQLEAIPTLAVQVMADGAVHLPLVDAVHVSGANLAVAQEAITAAYRQQDIIKHPRVTVSLQEKAEFDVSVLGEVTNPGVYSLPRYQNDVAHAIAQAGGFTETAAEVIEIHRRGHPIRMTHDMEPIETPGPAGQLGRRLPADGASVDNGVPGSWEETTPSVGQPSLAGHEKMVVRIPLRGMPPSIVIGDEVIACGRLSSEEIALRSGDVIVIPRKRDDVFFVVGPLDQGRVVNFTVTAQDRQLGNAFLIPNNRDIDVVTAVAMAGYIDPIDSPSTVTVQRAVPGAPPLLVHVDLIRARADWNENFYVEPGDIIYLNPDAAWWWRRTFDRVVPELLTIPYREAMVRWISPFGFR